MVQHNNDYALRWPNQHHLRNIKTFYGENTAKVYVPNATDCIRSL